MKSHFNFNRYGTNRTPGPWRKKRRAFPELPRELLDPNAPEEWRPIAENPVYFVSSKGRVKYGPSTKVKAELPSKKGHSHRRVSFRSKITGKNVSRTVARLVMYAFAPEIPWRRNFEVSFRDKNPNNCAIHNLYFRTKQEISKEVQRKRSPDWQSKVRANALEQSRRFFRFKAEMTALRKELKSLKRGQGLEIPYINRDHLHRLGGWFRYFDGGNNSFGKIVVTWMGPESIIVEVRRVG